MWFQHLLPSHGFIGWLPVQSKLYIMDRIASQCYHSVVLTCRFCDAATKSRDHLFFFVSIYKTTICMQQREDYRGLEQRTCLGSSAAKGQKYCHNAAQVGIEYLYSHNLET